MTYTCNKLINRHNKFNIMVCGRYGMADMVCGRYGFFVWPIWFYVVADIVFLWPISFVADMVALNDCRLNIRPGKQML